MWIRIQLITLMRIRIFLFDADPDSDFFYADPDVHPGYQNNTDPDLDANLDPQHCFKQYNQCLLEPGVQGTTLSFSASNDQKYTVIGKQTAPSFLDMLFPVGHICL